MLAKLCFFFYVWGHRKYYDYIPMVLYFIGKSHPDAHTVIACKEDCPEEILLLLDRGSNRKFIIEEGVLRNYPDDVNTSCIYRWILTPGDYTSYDYFYIGDIDILITDSALLSDHLKICQNYGLPYSNSDKIDVPPKTRFCGAHFYTQDYLNVMLPIMEKYRAILANSIPSIFWNKHANRIDNQKALREMVLESGLPMPSHRWFKYHGLHLGHSNVEDRWRMFFTTPNEEHLKYYDQFQQWVDTDEYRRCYDFLSYKDEIDIMISSWCDVQ